MQIIFCLPNSKCHFSPACSTFLTQIGRDAIAHLKMWLLHCRPVFLLLLLLTLSLSLCWGKKKGKNDSPIILRHCCQLFGRHRTEQRGALSIINSPLVVLSTRPMHFLKKYPVNMLCIGLVKRLDKRNQHPRNWCELCLPASAHNCLPECSVAGGLTWPSHLNMQFKGFQETFFDIITCQRHLAGKHKQFFYRGIYAAVLSCCYFW